MKRFFFLLTISLMLIGSFNNAYSATITAVATGNWSATGTWDGGVVPTYQDSVVVPSAYTVTIDVANTSCNGIYIEGAVKLNQTFYVCNMNIASSGNFYATYSSSYNLYWGILYNAGAVQQEGNYKITVDGLFGGSVAGTNDKININYGEKVASLTLDGTSTATHFITRFIPVGSNEYSSNITFNLNIKQNISITNTGYCLSLQNGRAFGGTRTMTIYPGYTVKLLSANGRFHASGSAPAKSQGDITYNIYGTLDLNAGNTTYFDIYSCTLNSTQNLTVNVGNGTDYGVLKLGRNINIKRYSETQAITLNWNNMHSRIVFGGAGGISLLSTACSGYWDATLTPSAYVDDARIFPANIRNLSYENTNNGANLTLPRKVSVTDTLYCYGYGHKLYAGTTSDANTRTVTLGKLFSLNGNAYVVTGVTTPLTTVTSTTLAAAGTWSKGATLTDASGNTYYCDSVGLYASNVVFPSSPIAVTAITEEITNAPILVTGNVINNYADTYTGRFSSNAYIGGNVTNGDGIILFAKNSTIGGTLTNGGTITSTAADLSVGSLVNNGSVAIGSKQLTLTGSLSGNAIDFSAAYLKFAGTGTQTLSSTQLGGDGTINYLRLAPGARLTTSGDFTVNTELDIQSNAASGTATIINNGNLTSTTNTFVKQYLANARNWYVSSPVQAASAPTGYSYYSYDETGQNTGYSEPATAYWTSVTSGSTFTPGKGYITLPEAAGSTLTFSGTLNSGNVSVNLTNSGAEKTGFNLIGNPYPCHLTWTDAFYTANNSLIEPTIWYRTNSGTANNSGQWSFPTINVHSGEASPVSTSNIIPAMQAFWIKAKTAGQLTMNSDLVKSHQSSNPLKVSSILNPDRKRLRLEVSNGEKSDETLIFFDQLANDEFDSYDSHKMFNNSVTIPEIYTNAGSEKLVINGLQSFINGTVIPLGFKTMATNEFTIKAIQVDNFDADTKIVLRDNLTGSETNLTLGETYSFTSEITDNSSRFSVVLKTMGATTDFISQNSKFYLWNNNGKIGVNYSGIVEEGSSIMVFNGLGQLVYQQKLSSNNVVLSKEFISGSYLVKVNDGSMLNTQKIIL